MRKLYHALCKFEVRFTCVAFCFLVFFVFLSAILRMFRVSMAWNIDLAMLLLAWTSFLGADIAWRSGQMIGVDLVARNLPRVLQKIVMIAIYVVILIAMIVVMVFGAHLIYVERVQKYQSMPIPYGLVTLSLVLAAADMIITTILKIRRSIRNFNDPAYEVAVKGQ
jgi:TRAP-type C4-dicarboxylate transport system permease small subunit